MKKTLYNIAQVITYIMAFAVIIGFLFALTLYSVASREPNQDNIYAFSLIAFLFTMIIATGIWIIPLFLCAYKMGQAKKGNLSQTSALVWSVILTVIAVIPGVIALIANFIEDTSKNGYTNDKLEGKLLSIEKLYNDNLITKEEYEELRRKIINKI